ncbi:thiamine-phosphate kinase [Pseudothauera hydrothermalis]|jgi:thiamine-monophosphate kinase|uniref:thiamine-phosphate kinase n=1 Tax=Pseudothauera hydrothermalis TaxID=2184083 RepID=UPI000C7B6215|nr:thiamine-phosphate kinase [Pseudothauera hydrothermalis]AUM01193.1 thiamine-phosphate kinase [Rhodocyclaceae bacterium]
MPSEFDLIRRHFLRPTQHTALAGGDDAALIAPRPGMQLAVSTDMLVAGTHFFADTDARDLGWKALAVNVSDLAAMGAEPRWAFLALALPTADDAWLTAFAEGFYACAAAFGVDLAGGDTTRGPLDVCVTVIGETPAGQALTRAGARPGDELWVSGQPGFAALGLWALRDGLRLAPVGRTRCLAALHRPQPRVALGQALRGVASAALDVSDGLIGDLRHLLQASGCGAQIDLSALPLAALTDYGAAHEVALRALLSGGDDYELLFTATAAHHADIAALAERLDLPLHCIGRLNDRPGEILLRAADGSLQPPQTTGYDHFA